MASYGLSPRVRGNRLSGIVHFKDMGSIPACTGEPPLSWAYLCRKGVYPRVYGGTSESVINTPNRYRSIPACTGEPYRFLPRQEAKKVYPRVYGGTKRSGRGPWCEQGLSPRVRGNQVELDFDAASDGSIPACTGEPPDEARQSLDAEVYPRVYGGTADRCYGRGCTGGLSPRVRGNPKLEWRIKRGSRSIPACTGEPTLDSGTGIND